MRVYVAADLSKVDLVTALMKTGFNPDVPILFIIEGALILQGCSLAPSSKSLLRLLLLSLASPLSSCPLLASPHVQA